MTTAGRRDGETARRTGYRPWRRLLAGAVDRPGHPRGRRLLRLGAVNRPGGVLRLLASAAVAPLLAACAVVGTGCAGGHTRAGGSFDWAAVTPSTAAHPAPARGQPTTRLDTLALAALDSAVARYAAAAGRRDPAAGYPRWAGPDGQWHPVTVHEWTTGFFPGTLWLLYRRTGDPALRAQAERWTAPLPVIFDGRFSHDLGFQFFTTFVAGYRLTGEERYRATALQAARLLAGRFSPRVGAIKSWDWMRPNRPYPVIADNMMNLELLLWGARHGGDPDWANLARRHAQTTIAHHIRSDGGSFHVVVFDTLGAVLERITNQGYADSSTWSRGQAWLVYGFTMAYRETGEKAYLATARRTADYFVSHLPADAIPCWDFQAPGCPPGPRDAAAAAIAASAVLELSTLTTGPEAARYRNAAERILGSLASSAYLAPAGAESLLLHATGNRPAGTEIDVGIIYADYYFVEALTRYLTLRRL